MQEELHHRFAQVLVLPGPIETNFDEDGVDEGFYLLEGELVLDAHEFGDGLTCFLVGGGRVHSGVIVAHLCYKL